MQHARFSGIIGNLIRALGSACTTESWMDHRAGGVSAVHCRGNSDRQHDGEAGGGGFAGSRLQRPSAAGALAAERCAGGALRRDAMSALELLIRHSFAGLSRLEEV